MIHLKICASNDLQISIFFIQRFTLYCHHWRNASSSVSSSHDRVTVNQLSIQTHFGHLIRRASSSRRPITVELSGAAANHRRAASRHSQSESWRRRTSTDKVSKMTLNITKVRKVSSPLISRPLTRQRRACWPRPRPRQCSRRVVRPSRPAASSWSRRHRRLLPRRRHRPDPRPRTRGPRCLREMRIIWVSDVVKMCGSLIPFLSSCYPIESYREMLPPTQLASWLMINLPLLDILCIL